MQSASCNCRRITFRALPACLFLVSLGFVAEATPVVAEQTVRYELQFPNAVHHEAEIRVVFSGVRQPVLEVVASRSSPGRYALHEFAKNIYSFRARDGKGDVLQVTRPNPYQWNVSGHDGTVVVEYTLYGDRADGTYNAIDSTHAHLNPPAALVWGRGFEKAPASLKFDIAARPDWKIATQLVPKEDGTWSAPDLDWLMDSPIEIGPYASSEWKIEDAQFRLAIHHRGTNEEAAAFARMCEAVVLEQEGVFGSLPKYDNGTYTFLVDYLPYVSGDGMEHRDSAVVTGTRDLKDSADELLGTISHEFFHSWNVKRIRPRALEPFDFERANMSGELWFAEGFTNYYGWLALKRAGLSSLDSFARQMAAGVNAATTLPGRLVFNVIGMSRHAPFTDAATSNDPVNFANTFISYYSYGQALAMGIDLAIRERFPGRTLDEWMRTMWREHPDTNSPYTLDDLQTALAASTGSEDFAKEVFQHYIYGREPMPYAALLEQAGFLVRRAQPGKIWLGTSKLSFTDDGIEIAGSTIRDSPGFNAGLDRGDCIIAWDGKRLKTEEELETWMALQHPGDHSRLTVNTRSGKKDVEVLWSAAPTIEVVPYEQAGRKLTPGMTSFRRAWLSSRAIHPLPHIEKYCPKCRRALAFEYEHCPYDGSSLRITPAAKGR